MKKVKVGVIGIGGRGRHLANIYNSNGHEGFELIAICDKNKATWDVAKNVLKDYKEADSITYYTDMHEMLANPELELVIIGTHDPDHTAPALAALKANKHLLLEKPLCQDLKEAQEIVTAAANSDKIFQVAFELREVSVFRMMKEKIDAGVIGDIKVIHACDNVSVGGAYFFHNPDQQEDFMKTLLLQKGSHTLDILSWLIGSNAKKVYATGGLDFYGGDEKRRDLLCRNCPDAKKCPHMIDYTAFKYDYSEDSDTLMKPDVCVWSDKMNLHDNAELLISYENGVKATYHEIHFSPDYTREFWIYGTKGRMTAHYENSGKFSIKIEPILNQGEVPTEQVFYPTKGEGHHGGGDNNLRDEVYRRVAENDQCEDVYESAYYSTAIAICAEESSKTGMPVEIPTLSI